jgi:ATP-dependent protease ClpP protease subunit
MATNPPTMPREIYISLAGVVDQSMTQRVFQSMAVALNGGAKVVHLLLQSAGGNVSDGVALYGYFKALPIDLRIYNAGQVSSIATVAFLGAKRRYASAHATFLVHRTHTNNQMPPANAARLRALADAFEIEDARTRGILEADLTITPEQLSLHLTNDLPFDAQAALACGLIHEIRDFVVPPGNILSNI